MPHKSGALPRPTNRVPIYNDPEWYTMKAYGFGPTDLPHHRRNPGAYPTQQDIEQACRDIVGVPVIGSHPEKWSERPEGRGTVVECDDPRPTLGRVISSKMSKKNRMKIRCALDDSRAGVEEAQSISRNQKGDVSLGFTRPIDPVTGKRRWHLDHVSTTPHGFSPTTPIYSAVCKVDPSLSFRGRHGGVEHDPNYFQNIGNRYKATMGLTTTMDCDSPAANFSCDANEKTPLDFTASSSACACFYSVAAQYMDSTAAAPASGSVAAQTTAPSAAATTAAAAAAAAGTTTAPSQTQNDANASSQSSANLASSSTSAPKDATTSSTNPVSSDSSSSDASAEINAESITQQLVNNPTPENLRLLKFLNSQLAQTAELKANAERFEQEAKRLQNVESDKVRTNFKRLLDSIAHVHKTNPAHPVLTANDYQPDEMELVHNLANTADTKTLSAWNKVQQIATLFSIESAQANAPAAPTVDVGLEARKREMNALAESIKATNQRMQTPSNLASNVFQAAIRPVNSPTALDPSSWGRTAVPVPQQAQQQQPIVSMNSVDNPNSTASRFTQNSLNNAVNENGKRAAEDQGSTNAKHTSYSLADERKFFERMGYNFTNDETRL